VPSRRAELVRSSLDMTDSALDWSSRLLKMSPPVIVSSFNYSRLTTGDPPV
jgi:hypothetical protein